MSVDEGNKKLDIDEVLSDEDKDTDVEDNTDDVEIVEIDEEVDFEDDDDDDDELETPTESKVEERLQDSEYHRVIKVVAPDDRMTSDIMTLYEFSEIIGIRSLQIEKGSPVFTDTLTLDNAYDMAIKELFDRKCPLKIIRKTGVFEQEEWKVNDMGFPADTRSGF